MPDSPVPRGRLILGIALALALIAAAVGLSLFRQPDRFAVTLSETRDLLSTRVMLVVAAPTEAKARALIEAGFRRIEALDATLNAHREDSELSRLNRTAAQRTVRVSADLYRILDAAVQWHRKTDGAFDITVGPLLDLWKRCGRAGRLPTEEERAAARALVGADRLILDPVARTAAFPVEGMRIDLGGLGKGFIADEVTHVLLERGAARALVSMSGDIFCLGTRPDGERWRVGVQDPRRPADPSALVCTLALADRAVSTSGNYQRFVTIQGERHSHIVDPRTGQTAEDVPGVTVIGPDATTTDVLDTALSVLGVERGLALLDSLPGVEALFITYAPDGSLRLTRTPRFHRYELSAEGGADARAH